MERLRYKFDLLAYSDELDVQRADARSPFQTRTWSSFWQRIEK
jgi:hypothetical protein